MTRVEWHRPENQTYQTGLDRGVIYFDDGRVVPWDGLSSVDDSGKPEIKDLYLDGIKFLAVPQARDWVGGLEAYSYPDEFGEAIGISKMTDGFYIDSQLPDRFSLSYRTVIAAPNTGGKPSYKIHLITNVVASLAEFGYQTQGDDISPTVFSFEFSAVPIRIPGRRPTAHLIIDSREIDPVLMAKVEDLLYGNDAHTASFPSVDALMDLLHFSNEVVVVDNGDGTWTATGSQENIRMLDSKGHFQINNAPAEYLSEDVYRFFGIESVAVVSLALDTDGVLYLTLSEESPNIAIDTDGAPYYSLGDSGAMIDYDTDGVPYVDFN